MEVIERLPWELQNEIIKTAGQHPLAEIVAKEIKMYTDSIDLWDNFEFIIDEYEDETYVYWEYPSSYIFDDDSVSSHYFWNMMFQSFTEFFFSEEEEERRWEERVERTSQRRLDMYTGDI